MKKLILPLAALALIFASCKKETPVPVSTGRTASTAEQVDALIHKADPELYAQLHGKAPKPDVKITHGVFIPKPDPASGTCHPPYSCVCHITITWPALVETEGADTTNLTSDYSAVYTEEGEAELIVNDSVPFSVKNLKSVDIVFDRENVGQSTITWSELEL